jgi:hypothetical protein
MPSSTKITTSRLSAALAAAACFWMAACSNPKADFAEAARQDTVAAYEAFLAKHPRAEAAAAARERIGGLLWAEAEKDGTRAAYTRLLADPRAGTRLPDARRAIEALDWTEAAAAGTAAALEAFLQAYPESSHAGDARRAADALRWAAARQARTLEAAEAFLAAHPGSAHAEDARAFVKGLKWAGAKASNGGTQIMGMFWGGYTRFVKQLSASQDLECELGSATARWTVEASDGTMDLASDGSRLARNGAVVAASGLVAVKLADGTAEMVRIAGLLWKPDDNLLGSVLYSYDTAMGLSDPSRFAGWKAVPALDPAKPIAAFRITESGGIVFEP